MSASPSPCPDLPAELRFAFVEASWHADIVHQARDAFFATMAAAGIGDGDILLVNRAKQPRHGNIVIAEVDNDFTVKYLHQRAGRIKLCASDPTFPDILMKDGQQLTVVGVVTAVIKQFK